MEEILTIVGEHIKDYRMLKRLSRRALGELIGISGQAIWKIETGRSDPKLTNLNKIAEALGVRLDALITGQQVVFRREVAESDAFAELMSRIEEEVSKYEELRNLAHTDDAAGDQTE